MRICPNCKRHAHVKQVKKVDDKDKKWLIDVCTSCGFNLEIEEYHESNDSPKVAYWKKHDWRTPY